MATLYQTTPEPSHDPRKYAVGTLLRFIKYASSPGGVFRPGTYLKVTPDTNADGQGIQVRRNKDGYTDLVWPEEVEVVRES